jgi:hypothetical protein
MTSHPHRFTITLALATVLSTTLACTNLPIGTPTPVEGPVAGDTTPTPTAVIPAGGLGTVSGTVCFPSEPPLPSLTLYFQETTTNAVTSLLHDDGTGLYTIDLVPGTYVAWAWSFDFGSGGSYSQAVPCGLNVSCTDHTMLPFTVTAGAATTNIDICDWYGEAGDVPTPPAGGEEPTTGTVTGRVCYPSEGIPPMTAYFQDTATSAVTTLDIAQNQGTYSIDLLPATYIAYAWLPGFTIGGSYSQAVPCGLTVSCTDHTPIPITVAAGGTVDDVDICDWYSQDSVPLPPGGSGPTPPAPPGGVSLNCDGTYQRLRVTDGGAAGKTVSVDNWDGSSWVNTWNWAGGDPMVRQITDDAGLYSFGGCQQLVVVPMVYGGSGAVLELTIHAWNGSGLDEVYLHEGTHGTWSHSGANVIFEESVYLHGEPNCCPCNRQYLQHTWDGAAFVQTGSAINPTYSGTPPPECVP